MKHEIDNRTRALESTGVPYIVSKFHELWYTNGIKLDGRFYPPSVFCSVSSPSHTLQAALTWHPTANLNEMEFGLSAAQIQSPQKFNFAMASHWAAISGNALLILPYFLYVLLIYYDFA